MSEKSSLLLKTITPKPNNEMNQFIISSCQPYYNFALFTNNFVCSALPKDIKNIIFFFLQESVKENKIDYTHCSKAVIKLGLFQRPFTLLKTIEMQEMGREIFPKKIVELFKLMNEYYSNSSYENYVFISLSKTVFDVISQFIDKNPILLQHPKISKEELKKIATALQYNSLNFDFLSAPKDSLGSSVCSPCKESK